jgi:anti-sigma regulatory factor (Ser/Thr protein kinase)
MKATRVFQLTALALVVVAAVQVGYWLFDQQTKAMEKVRDERALYSRQVGAAQAMLESGVRAERVPPAAAGSGRRRLAGNAVADCRRDALERSAPAHQSIRLGRGLLPARPRALHRCHRARLASGSQGDPGAGQLPGARLAPVQDPLASLQLSLETMAMRTLSPDQGRTLIDRMLSDLGRMEAMVTQILESVRLERGRVDLRREPLDLSGAVTRVVAQFEERAHKDNITITADIARGLYVLTDPLALDVVVRNLLENAIAAITPVGGGTIAFVARRTESEIELSVRDSGVGFRPADGVRLFEKFTRLHPGGGSSYYGTGLGLFIVRRLMQLAGGRVSAHSEGVGQGAKFVLTWPVAPAEST